MNGPPKPVSHSVQIPADEIVDRCLYALINEGASILEEGSALRAVDIDIIYINGYGFPAYRGGPMWYRRHRGAEESVRAASANFVGNTASSGSRLRC